MANFCESLSEGAEGRSQKPSCWTKLHPRTYSQDILKSAGINQLCYLEKLVWEQIEIFVVIINLILYKLESVVDLFGSLLLSDDDLEIPYPVRNQAKTRVL